MKLGTIVLVSQSIAIQPRRDSIAASDAVSKMAGKSGRRSRFRSSSVFKESFQLRMRAAMD